MYPFPHVRAAWNRLWRRIALELEHAPRALDWDRDLHQVWRDPALLLGVTCGWPLVTQLGGGLVVVGTFDPAVPLAATGRYRSVLIASQATSVAGLHALPRAVAAVNGTDSLSGWVSLCHAWGGTPADVMVTGSHLASMRAVARGDAQVASIDAVSYELVAAVEPATTAALHVVGHGPLVPALPIVTAAANAARVPELRNALAVAVTDPALAATCAALLIRGFVPFDRADYEPLLHLAP